MYFAYTQIEHFIIAGRLLLATFSLGVYWLYPLRPLEHVAIIYALLTVYIAYSALLIPFAWWKSHLRWYGFVTYFVDLLSLMILLHFTGGSDSPFLLFLVFLPLIATLRWQWRGTLWTAVVVMMLYYTLEITTVPIQEIKNSRLNIYLIHSAVFIGIAALLGFMSTYEQRLRRQLTQLTDWPGNRDIPTKFQIQEILKIIADIFKVSTIIMIWKDSDESWCHIAVLEQDDFRLIRELPEEFEPLVADSLSHYHFIRPDPRNIQPSLFLDGLKQLRVWRGNPLNNQLETRFAMGRTLSLALSGSALSGRLFVLNKQYMTLHDLIFGEIVAGRIVANLEQWRLQRRLRQTAVMEERFHLARELHDGLLQSLTAINLQMTIIRRLLETSPEAAQERLADIQTLVADEQRELRLFVQQLKSASPDLQPDGAQLATRLEELKEKMVRHWKLAVNLQVATLPQTRIPAPLVHGVYRLVQEALVNAIRHGGASTAQVEVSTNRNELCLVVIDNGSGFPFRGRYDLATLNKLRQGPISIKGRITFLQGSLIIDSTESGSHLEITLPLP